MKEFSEKELEDQYKNWKMMDVPPMWDEIEKNLAPKENRVPVSVVKRKRFPVRRMAAAAAILCVLLLGPAWYQIRKGLSVKSESGSVDESVSSDGSWEEAEAGCAPEEILDMAESSEAGASEEAVSEEAVNKAEKAEGVPAPVFQAKIQVKEVQVLEQEVQVTAWIMEPGDGPFKEEEEIVMLYEGEEYQEADFSGVLHVRLQIEEKNLKLLEILP